MYELFIFVRLQGRSETITAANPVIRCRCGMPAPTSFCQWSFPRRKVTVKSHFCRHLLEFVISRPASEVILGSPVSVSCREGADQNSISPAPSRFRYKPTCLRGLSRHPCPGDPIRKVPGQTAFRHHLPKMGSLQMCSTGYVRPFSSDAPLVHLGKVCSFPTF